MSAGAAAVPMSLPVGAETVSSAVFREEVKVTNYLHVVNLDV